MQPGANQPREATVGADDRNCRGFCDTLENKGFCDENMRAYCNTSRGKTDSRCKCINSTFPGPACLNPDCTARSYRTGDLLRQTCPKCANWINQQGDSVFVEANQTLICEGGKVKKITKPTVPEPKPTPTVPEPKPTPTVPEPAEDLVTNIVDVIADNAWIGIPISGVLAVLIAIVTIYMYVTRVTK